MWKKFKQFLSHIFFTEERYENQQISVDGKNYLVRKLRYEDIKGLLSLEREVYTGQLPWTKSAFVSELRPSATHLYLGIFEGLRVVAFIGGRIIGSDVHITNVAVSPSLQNKGIGAFLIDEIEKFAIMRRCETISLEVRISNKNAQHLYRKKGFVSRTIKRQYYDQTNEDALDMVKFLKSE